MAKQLPERIERFEVGWGGMMYMLVSALVAAIAFHTQANLLFWAFGLLLGALVISLAFGAVMLRGLEVQRRLPEHAVAGEATALGYDIINHSRWLPVFGLMITEIPPRSADVESKANDDAAEPSMDVALPGKEGPRWGETPLGWVLHIGPRQTVHAQAIGRPQRRGDLPLGRIVLMCSFPFGILERRVEVRDPATLLVYPRLYRIRPELLTRLIGRDPSGRRFVERGGGGEEFFGLREYRTGDSLKRLDWKHSARFGQLVAREMTQPALPRVRVTLDLESPSQDASEQALALIESAIDLTASIICEAYLHGHEVGLTVLAVHGEHGVHGAPAMESRIQHSLLHRAHLLETLARLDVMRSHESSSPTASMDIPSREAFRSAGGITVVPGSEPASTAKTASTSDASSGSARGSAHGGARGGRVVLFADRLEQYTRAGSGGAAVLSASPARQRGQGRRTQEPAA